MLTVVDGLCAFSHHRVPLIKFHGVVDISVVIQCFSLLILLLCDTELWAHQLTDNRNTSSRLSSQHQTNHSFITITAHPHHSITVRDTAKRGNQAWNNKNHLKNTIQWLSVTWSQSLRMDYSTILPVPRLITCLFHQHLAAGQFEKNQSWQRPLGKHKNTNTGLLPYEW